MRAPPRSSLPCFRRRIAPSRALTRALRRLPVRAGGAQVKRTWRGRILAPEIPPSDSAACAYATLCPCLALGENYQRRVGCGPGKSAAEQRRSGCAREEATLPPRFRSRAQAAEGTGSAAKGVANGTSYIRLSKARAATRGALSFPPRGGLRLDETRRAPAAPARRWSSRGRPTPRRATSARALTRRQARLWQSCSRRVPRVPPRPPPAPPAERPRQRR